MILLGIDPSLSATGLAVVRLTATDAIYVASGFIETKPDAKGRHLYQADADGARVDRIVDLLDRCIGDHAPTAIACEAPAGSQHAVSAKALGLAYGAARAVLLIRGYTPIMVQAHHAKMAATGKKSATKEEVIAATEARFGVVIEGTKPRREAIADALAVCCAAMNEPTVKAMRARVA